MWKKRRVFPYPGRFFNFNKSDGRNLSFKRSTTTDAAGMVAKEPLQFKSERTIYTVNSFLGNGSYGKCYDVTPSVSVSEGGTGGFFRATGRFRDRFTLKVMETSSAIPEKQKSLIAREIQVHQRLQHKNIVQLSDTFDDDKGNTCLVLELCSNLSVADFIATQGPMSTRLTAQVLRGLLKGLVYLHEKVRIIHRDIKPGNIMLTEDMRVKISDFGLACTQEQANAECGVICGTPNYLAPEIFLKQVHSPNSDIWAVGVTLFFMLCGRTPFAPAEVAPVASSRATAMKGEVVRTIYRSVLAGTYNVPTNFSLPARQFIFRCLRRDPQLRPTPGELLELPFTAKQCSCRRPLCLCTVKSLGHGIASRMSRSITSLVTPTGALLDDHLSQLAGPTMAETSPQPVIDMTQLLVDRCPAQMDRPPEHVVWVKQWASTDADNLYYLLSDDSCGSTDLMENGLLLKDDGRLIEFQAAPSTPSTQIRFPSPGWIRSKCDCLRKQLTSFSPDPQQVNLFFDSLRSHQKQGNCNIQAVNVTTTSGSMTSSPHRLGTWLTRTLPTKKQNRLSAYANVDCSLNNSDPHWLALTSNSPKRSASSASGRVDLSQGNRDMSSSWLYSSPRLNKPESSMVFVRQWVSQDDSMLFCFSNGSWQVNFYDHTKLLSFKTMGLFVNNFKHSEVVILEDWLKSNPFYLQILKSILSKAL